MVLTVGPVFLAGENGSERIRSPVEPSESARVYSKHGAGQADRGINPGQPASQLLPARGAGSFGPRRPARRLGGGAGASEEVGQALCEGGGVIEWRAFGDQSLVVQNLDPGGDIAGFFTIAAFQILD